MSAASRIAATMLETSAPPPAGDVEGGAVIRRGSRERQPERHVHPVGEMNELEGDQALVVIEGDHRVELALPRAEEDRIRRMRSIEVAGRALAPSRRRDAAERISSSPNTPPSPACGLRPGERESRAANAEVAPQRLVGDLRRAQHVVAGDARRHVAQADVGGDEHDPQRRPGHHHAHLGARSEPRDRLGVARETRRRAPGSPACSPAR